MNRKSLIAAAALAAASATSFAVDEQTPAAASTLSREEVRAEFDQLRAAGALPAVNEASPSPLEADALAERAATLTTQDSLPAEDAVDPLRSEGELTGQVPQHLMFVSPQGTVTIIESMPAPDTAAAADGSLPFVHPAVPGDAR